MSTVATRPTGPPSGAQAAAPAPRRRRRPVREGGHALAFLTPSLLGLGLFTLLPCALAVAMSFFDWPALGTPRFVGLANYAKMFGESGQFGAALRNTVLYAVVIVPLNLVFTLGAALWIARSRFRNVYRVLFFLPVVTPVVATTVVWKLLYQPHGIIDQVLAGIGVDAPNFLGDPHTAMGSVILASLWQGFGYNMLIFSAAIDQLPDAVLEAAEVDGCTGLRRVLRITVPLLSPSIFFATTVTMIQALQVFAEPLILTAGGPGSSTVTVVMNVYQTAFLDGNLGLAAAVAWVLFALIMIVTGVQWRGQKRWVHYEH
ncbi:carbohydrate ABC transporter permease [Kribbella sp. NPDC059898]|uniref:carbohydrate ABC transporter permease n=1 Tax=Kribbella sp. NPDC059898 TaxID=3346995 RepID=UPI003648F71D